MSQRPPLAALHDANGARTTEFGGWEMPVRFTSISEEHAAVREAAGLFDVSHMSRVVVSGPDAAELVDRLTTNDVRSLDPCDAQYACITRKDGVILDDTVVYRRPRGDFLFVPNAGNGEPMTDRWRDHAERWTLDATVEDVTDDTGMIAVQGPTVASHVDELADDVVADLGRFEMQETTIAGVDCHAARTGYTGEDGFELVVPAAGSETVWTAFRDRDIQPCGLGARDTLRIEAGLLLSGQDFHPEDEPRTPFEAGLGFVVALDTEFVGRDALAAQQQAGVDERLVGIELDERGVPRHGCALLVTGERVGHVTSGTLSPTLDIPIGFGYVDSQYADDGTAIDVEIRDTAVPATVVGQRFLDRHRS